MKFLIEQKGRTIFAEFCHRGIVDKYKLDKADDFLLALDKFSRRRKISSTLFKGARFEFNQTSILTERIIKAILQALVFSR